MGKLTQMVNQDIIDGFKGVIDFYLYKGIPCFRKWPKKPDLPRTPEVKAQWPAFTIATQSWNLLPPYVQDAYKRMAHGTNLSGRDMFTKSYLNGNFIKLE